MIQPLRKFMNRDDRFPPDSGNRSVIRFTMSPEEQDERWELRKDIERLGGVASANGYSFSSEYRRDDAAEILIDNWGDGYFESINSPDEVHTHLLIAAPNINERARMAAFFRTQDFSIELAPDAIVALHSVAMRYPGALIIDSQLLWGGADGLLGCLREAPLFGHVPVVVVCEEFETARSEFCDPPVVACLARPFRFEDVFARLQSHIEGKERVPYPARSVPNSQ